MSCDLLSSLTLAFSQNQMFSKFNALGLDNLIQATLTKGSDITSDIENRLKTG
jgi:hypothetical protein